jgi:hypothetical protein
MGEPLPFGGGVFLLRNTIKKGLIKMLKLKKYIPKA